MTNMISTTTTIYIFWVLCTIRYCVSQETADDGGTCTGVFCKKTVENVAINYAAYVRVENKLFNRTAVKEVRVSGTANEREKKCADACTDEGHDQCKSAHLEPYSASSPASLCSFFSEDVYGQYPDEAMYLRQDMTGYVSFHLKNTFCEKSPCQNNAYCAANFTQDNGTCVCKGYSGKYCENYDVLHYDDVLHYNFDNGKFENIGYGKDYWGTGTLDKGKIIRFPSRRSRGLACYKEQNPCMRPIKDEKADCLSLFSTYQDFSSICPHGFTIAFWVRILWRESTEHIHVFYHNPGLLFWTKGDVVHFGFEFKDVHNNCIFSGYHSKFLKQWNFIIATWDRTDKKFLCAVNDEEPINDVYRNAVNPPNEKPFQIGPPSHGSSFLMDDFIYFERTSTPEEMKHIYKATKEKP